MNDRANRRNEFLAFFHILSKLWKRSWKRHKTHLALLILLTICVSLAPVGSAWVSKVIFNSLADVISESTDRHVPNDVLAVLILQIMLTLFVQFADRMITFISSQLNQELSSELRVGVYEIIASAGKLDAFEENSRQNQVWHSMAGASQLPSSWITSSTQLLKTTTMIIGFTGLLLSVDYFLLIAILLSVIPKVVAARMIGRQRAELNLSIIPHQRRIGYLVSILTSTDVVKDIVAYRSGNYFAKLYRNSLMSLIKLQRDQQSRELRWHMALDGVSTVSGGVAFALVVFQAFQGSISIGDVTLFVSASAALTGTFLSLVPILESVSEVNSYDRSISELERTLGVGTALSGNRTVWTLGNCIEFCNVSFRYSQHHPWILRNFNLKIHRNSLIALIGKNGSGKTTVLKILARLHEPTEGQILWDGVDIREFEIDDYRSHVGVMFQDFARYNLTAYENIGLGNIRRLDEEKSIVSAASDADAHQIIERLPNGYQTYLGRGLNESQNATNLSGGQWQRVALARLLMRNAEVVILDEPTASLDPQAEEEFVKSLRAILSQRTGIIISHRMKAAELADVVIVLEDGSIVETRTREAYSPSRD